jgi:hypothetical protein
LANPEVLDQKSIRTAGTNKNALNQAIAMKIALIAIVSALFCFALKAQEVQDIPKKAQEILRLNPEATFVEADKTNDGEDTLLCFKVPDHQYSKLWVWVEMSDKLDVELFPYFSAAAIDSQKTTLVQMRDILKAAAEASKTEKPEPNPQIFH